MSLLSLLDFEDSKPSQNVYDVFFSAIVWNLYEWDQKAALRGLRRGYDGKGPTVFTFLVLHQNTWNWTVFG